MVIDPATVLAFAQVGRIAFNVLDEYRKGELTQASMDAAWSAIHIEASSARRNWEASKDAPSATARRQAEQASTINESGS